VEKTLEIIEGKKMKHKKRIRVDRVLILVIALLLILFGSIMIIKKISAGNNTPGSNNIPNEPVNEEPSDKGIEEPEEIPVEQPDPVEEPEEIPSESEENPDAEESLEIEEVVTVGNPGAIDVLVNRVNNLPSDYVPEDLTEITELPTVLLNPEVNQLREAAYEALKNLFAAAKEEGYDLYARSGYRSYNTQSSLYSSYVANHGQAAADTFSAKPGQSEHQTGLSMDITCEAMNFALDDTFGETAEGKWVSENAHNYGFIVRYPKGKEDITGYMYEPWHIRYLGVEMATDVYESGLTLEEFFEQ